MNSPLPEREVEIGRRLRVFRESKRISRTAFALSVGIGAERLASYEAGRVPLRYSVFRSIADQYALNPFWLAAGHGTSALPEPFDLSSLGSEPALRAKFSQVFDEVLEPALMDESVSVLWYLRRLYNILSAFQDRFRARPETINPRFWSLLGEVLIAVRQNVPPSRAECRKSRSGAKESTKALELHLKESSTKLLTEPASAAKVLPVKSQLDYLLAGLDRLTKEPGNKTALADFLGAPLASVSRWLSGKREPGREITLKMLRWVELQERQQNTLGSVTTTTKGKTQLRSSKAYEKTKSNPHKG